MLFRIRKYVRDTNKGINKPSDFVFEQMTELALAPFIIPALIVVVILVGLGILGFSHWIFANGSPIARVFFWIFTVFAAITATGMIIMYRGVKKLWKRTAQHMNIDGKTLYDITDIQNKSDTLS